jgi:transitional endoplasmic reticulum ATPase
MSATPTPVEWHTGPMAAWRVREFHEDDLDAAVTLWGDPRTSGETPVFGLSDLVSAVRVGEPAVAAVVGEELVGTAVATVSNARAWVVRISLSSSWRNRGIGSAMLTELERRLVAAGVHRIDCLLGSDDEVGALALRHCGYRVRPGMVFYEKLEPVGPEDVGILGRLGGRMLHAGIWAELEGMAREKDLIERRVILPLAEPRLAERLGLVPPRAVVLFGPPGTGKTTFAKGVAARLGWPFVELFPSRLAGDSPAGLAAALRESFALVAELDKVLLFIDEVEEIAGLRQPRNLSAAQGVTNEMLKLIPVFREQDQRLLICATNSVRGLDTAFLRHGRFDYVLPVGPPDDEARRAIWDRYLRSIPHDEIDMAAVVDQCSLFTPADIEFAARRTAQLVFERVLLDGGEELAATGDILRGIAETRRTLTQEMVSEFDQDIADFARV